MFVGFFFEGDGFKYNTNSPIGKLHGDHVCGLASLFQKIFSVQSVCGRLFDYGERSVQNVCYWFRLWRALHHYFFTEFQRSDLLQRPISNVESASLLCFYKIPMLGYYPMAKKPVVAVLLQIWYINLVD